MTELNTNQLKLLDAVDEVLRDRLVPVVQFSPTRSSSDLGVLMVAALAKGYTFLSLNAASAEAVIEDEEGERDTSLFLDSYGLEMTPLMALCLCIAGDATLIRAAQKFFPLPPPVMVDESKAVKA